MGDWWGGPSCAGIRIQSHLWTMPKLSRKRKRPKMFNLTSPGKPREVPVPQKRTSRRTRHQTKEELGGLGRGRRVCCARVPQKRKGHGCAPPDRLNTSDTYRLWRGHSCLPSRQSCRDVLSQLGSSKAHKPPYAARLNCNYWGRWSNSRPRLNPVRWITFTALNIFLYSKIEKI